MPYLLCSLLFFLAIFNTQAYELPFDRIFKGQEKFDHLVNLAKENNWKSLPIGKRTITVGEALCGTPYKNYTLEIDDHIEAPSINLDALDCWTFYESSLAFARMLDMPETDWTPQTMLRLVEMERYRGGHCTGQYLSRIHFLEDLFHDNQRRGLLTDITKSLGGTHIRREVREMTVAWKSYRYLRNNPSLLPRMAAIEERDSDLTVYHIPKRHVAQIVDQIQDGDIIAITGYGPYDYTSHVGLAVHDSHGILHFMHASYNHRKVMIDQSLVGYLYRYSSDDGIIIARPKNIQIKSLDQIAQYEDKLENEKHTQIAQTTSPETNTKTR
jgi:hypothetical protein